MYIYIYIHIHIHVYIYIYIYMCVCTHIYIYIYIYIYTYMWTPTYSGSANAPQIIDCSTQGIWSTVHTCVHSANCFMAPEQRGGGYLGPRGLTHSERSGEESWEVRGRISWGTFNEYTHRSLGPCSPSPWPTRSTKEILSSSSHGFPELLLCIQPSCAAHTEKVATSYS